MSSLPLQEALGHRVKVTLCPDARRRIHRVRVLCTRCYARWLFPESKAYHPDLALNITRHQCSPSNVQIVREFRDAEARRRRLKKAA